MRRLKIAKRQKPKPVKLEGERLLWFELASHLRIPVCELKERIEYSEFLEWCQFFQVEKNRHTKMDHYLAQIAMEIRRSYVDSKKVNKVRLADFFMRFATPSEVMAETTEDLKAARTAVSKGAWFAALGMQMPQEN